MAVGFVWCSIVSYKCPYSFQFRNFFLRFTGSKSFLCNIIHDPYSISKPQQWFQEGYKGIEKPSHINGIDYFEKVPMSFALLIRE